jgi:hypothetical protein
VLTLALMAHAHKSVLHSMTQKTPALSFVKSYFLGLTVIEYRWVHSMV